MSCGEHCPLLPCLPECRQCGLLCSKPAADCIAQYPPGKAIHYKGEVVKTVIDFLTGDVRTPGFIHTAQHKVFQQVVKAHHPAAVSGPPQVNLSCYAEVIAPA